MDNTNNPDNPAPHAVKTDRQKAAEASKVIRETENEIVRHELDFEPAKKPKKLKQLKKTNKTKGKQEVKTLNNQKTKSIIETLKTIAIVFMLTAVTFFVLGMKYQEEQAARHQKTAAEVAALKQPSQSQK